ncbi:FMN-binding negative transcriptional regulator [Ferruginibacter sp. HRS2-29]|uniref:FMN-binding negative transcriptional regulator n=1 Tax=Ferruginibacter sp. HRS2-29 TaxID=2487334 RepID=UPI0020CC4DEA
MYKLPYYTENDQEKVLSFIKENSFALVTGSDGEYPVSSHLPLDIIEEAGKLFFTGHLMKKTSHHFAFEKNENVLVVFHSPHAYIDANWYGSKAVASTVNYIAVHAKGKIKFTDDAGTYEAIKSITDKHIGTDSAASFNNIPKEYTDAMLKAIIGFRIEVVSMENVFKLSQNRNEEDRAKIISHLEERNIGGDAYIAGEMKKLFTK